MSRIQLVKELRWEMAHRLPFYQGLCGRIHGHSYRAQVIITGELRSATGMIMDFKDVKRILGGWIDENWDHRLMLATSDPLVKNKPLLEALGEEAKDIVVVPFPPTAEFLAAHLGEAKFPQILSRWAGFEKLQVTGVNIWETASACAEWRAK